MEVLVGSTFEIEGSSPSAAAAAAYVVANPSQEKNSSPCIFLKEDEIVGSGSFIGAQDNDSSDSSSSIGAPDDSDEEEGDEVESDNTALNSLDSLEESLPNKRGLSNHFSGKSKSFASLADVVTSSSSVTVKDLEKPENPFNKRRRLVLVNKWSRKSSFYSWSNPKSMPLLALNEQDELQQHDEDDDEEAVSEASPCSSSSDHEILKNQALREKKFNKSFKSHSCFCLANLQHEEFQ